MTDKLITPRRLLVLVWIGLPVLAVIVSSVGDSLQEGWRTQPPSEVEATDCRIESMMEGDNPVEVEIVQRACLQAANDAYVQPRTRRLRLLSGMLLLAYAAGAGVLTLRQKGAASA